MTFSTIKTGLFSFTIVLLFMPLGHALMVLNEIILHDQKLIGAFAIGLLGVLLLSLGIKKNNRNNLSTLFGFLAGIFVWTGWIEFSFVWIADKLQIPGLSENGTVVTKPEYLIMPSSIGFLGSFFLLYLFSQNRCQFFNWFQRVFKIKGLVKLGSTNEKPLAIITFIETIMVLWTFYIVLLLVYDPDIAGDNHPLTYIVAFGSLLWAIYLFVNLIRIKTFDYAIRYAIPTVIIFWNFVEVMGRWNLFQEIWIHPFQHWIELAVTSLILLGLITNYIIDKKQKNAFI